MALPKLYELITWVNGTTPALNEDNLNAMSQALDDIDDRVIDLAGTIMEDVPQIQEDMAILGPAVESIDENVARAEAAADSAEQYAEEIAPPIEVVKDYADIITIEDAINKPVKDLKIKIEAVQSGSGTPSPDNVRPITGHSEVKVTRAGKNLFDFNLADLKTYNTLGTWSGNAYTYNGITFTVNDDKTITANGTASGLAALYFDTNAFRAKAWGGKVLNGCLGGSTNSYYLYIAASNDGSSWAADIYQTNADLTIPSYPYYKRLAIEVKSGTTLTNKVFLPMISAEGGAFEPFVASDTFTIDLDGTRYGGVLDVDAGTLTLTHTYKEFTSTDSLTWYKVSNKLVYYTAWTKVGKACTSTGVTGSISSAYENVTKASGGLNNGEFIQNTTDVSSSMDNIIIMDERFTSAADFKASLTTPLQLVYELATPQTIQLTAEEVQLLWAYNTLWADTGDIALTYDASGVLRIANAKLDIDTFKSIVAASSDFSDFKSRVAAL